MLENHITLSINLAFEYGDDLVFPLFVQRVKTDGWVFLEKILVLIAFQPREHRAVFHVVSVDDRVGAERHYGTPLVDEGDAAPGFRRIKAVRQIKIIRRIHDGIVDTRTIYPDPARHVRVLLVKRPILLQHDRLLGRLHRYWRCRG
ncbi:hypothetical protein SDC9_206202 [bioreactor metagenome]|uniref:Uncharacterized protein n=1 Tax=bioreactor metagenome TaxID=1076179 RepID=A0A645J531_9ZZZZ